MRERWRCYCDRSDGTSGLKRRATSRCEGGGGSMELAKEPKGFRARLRSRVGLPFRWVKIRLAIVRQGRYSHGWQWGHHLLKTTCVTNFKARIVIRVVSGGKGLEWRVEQGEIWNSTWSNRSISSTTADIRIS